MSDLPKDVGLCAQCGARNSKLGSRCHACGSTLPWVQAKPSKIPKIGAKTTPPANNAPRFDAPGFATPSTPAPQGGGLDVAGTAQAIGLGVACFLLSFMCCLPGFFLYRHFNSEESWLQYPCLAGGICNALGFVFLRSR